jgi:hypothetical protein
MEAFGMLLLTIFAICAIAGVIWWAIKYVGAPEPIAKIATVAIVLLSVLAIIYAVKASPFL